MSGLMALTREMLADTETPVSAYLKLCKGKPESFLLESGEWSETAGRYSVVGWQPLASLVLDSSGAHLSGLGGQEDAPPQEFFEVLRRAQISLDCNPPQGLPFVGGMVGYVGWETASLIERLPSSLGDDPPTARLSYPSRLVIIDHLQRVMTLVAIGEDGETCGQALDEMAAGLRMALPAPSPAGHLEITPPDRQAYEDAVSRSGEYILDGDIFQVVLSAPFKAKGQVDPLDVYRWLRVRSPSPYMFFLDLGDMQLAGSSPETLVKVSGDQLGLRPIAGTRGRSQDPAKDLALEKEMVESEKECAEHLMLVDLGRNDAGRVCVPGTVRVDPYMTVERFSHVMHMVSQVHGTLLPEVDAIDAFKAAFPAGTVSGAPKVRAMEIIHELEGSQRGPYGGAVGFFGPGRRVDTCLAIRMIQFQGQDITVQAGAGIVADSNPAHEYKEISHKAAQSLAALEAAARGGM